MGAFVSANGVSLLLLKVKDEDHGTEHACIVTIGVDMQEIVEIRTVGQQRGFGARDNDECCMWQARRLK